MSPRPSSGTSTPAAGQSVPERQGDSLASSTDLSSVLWRKARDALKADEPKLVDNYRDRLPRSLATLDEANRVSEAAPAEIQANQQKQFQLAVQLLHKRSGRSEKFIELSRGLVKFVQWGSDPVSTAVSSQPYASLAWVGVSLLLPVS